MKQIIISSISPRKYLKQSGFTKDDLKGKKFNNEDDLREFLDSHSLEWVWDYCIDDFSEIINRFDDDDEKEIYYNSKDRFAYIFGRLWEVPKND